MAFRPSIAASGTFGMRGAPRAEGEAREKNMRQHFFAILLSLVASVASGAIFLVSLLHQFALVEVAASLVTGLQVFFLSSAIGDMLERKKKASGRRTSWIIAFTLFLIAFYSFTRYLH